MENKVKFIFFGTPDFAVEVLNALSKKGFIPSLVITAPDRKQGRNLVMTSPPVKVWAEDNKIPILQPEKLNDETYEKIAPETWDIFVVAAYNKLIPERFLNIPRNGALNIHPSMLPRLRGPSPVRSAILNEEQIGVSIMLLDKEMDHGPIIAQKEIKMERLEKGSKLEHDLFRFGGELLAEIINDWISGKIKSVPQDDSKATFTKKISKENGLIDPAGDPKLNYLKFLAYDGWPGIYFFTEKGGKKIRVIIKDADFKDGAFIINKVIPEGKKEISYNDFNTWK